MTAAPFTVKAALPSIVNDPIAFVAYRPSDRLEAVCVPPTCVNEPLDPAPAATIRLAEESEPPSMLNRPVPAVPPTVKREVTAYVPPCWLNAPCPAYPTKLTAVVRAPASLSDQVPL